jgi:hypothetical protein
MKAHITQLFAVLLSKGDHQRLASVVEQSKKQLFDEGQENLWFYWKGQSLVALGEPEQALQLLAKMAPDHARDLEMVARRAIAQKTGDKGQFAHHLLRMYEQTHNALYLFEWGELKASEGDWAPVAERAQLIFDEIGTAQALRLAAYAFFQAGQPSRGLEMLSSKVGLFPNSQLPADLRRLRIACEQRMGLIGQAVKDAEVLADETGHFQDKINLINLKLTTGDSKGAHLIAREFLSRPDAKPEHLLQLADLTRGEDVSLAQDFLAAAVTKGEMSPDLFPAAVHLAFHLNREDLLPKLYPGFLAAAKDPSGPVKGFSLAEVVQMLDSSRKRQMEISQLYRQGRVPLHFIIEEFGAAASVSSIVHRCFRPDPNLHPSRLTVFIRHGGRAGRPVLEAPSRLYMDITALLLAAELNILDELENAFPPIILSPNINQILSNDIQKCGHHQPSRLENGRFILSLVEAGNLAPVQSNEASPQKDDGLDEIIGTAEASLLRQARELAGYLVEFLPLKRGIEERAIEIPVAYRSNIIGCSSILNALSSGGRLTQHEEALARENLKQICAQEVPSAIELNVPIILTAGVVDALASAKLLSSVTSCFKVFIHADTIRSIRAEMAQEEWDSKLRSFLQGLRERIRKGLESGCYQLMPVTQPLEREMQEMQLPPVALSAVYLLKAEPTPRALVWVDERMLNSARAYGQILATDAFEILSLLHSTGRLDQPSYYAKLQALRDANFRYIPINKDEILYHLQRANLRDGRLIETPELRSVRRAAAAYLLDKDSLQKPGTEGLLNPLGEIEVVMELYKSAREAIVESIAGSIGDDKKAFAWADWILSSLWFDISWLPSLLGTSPENQEEHDLLGNSLSHLYSHAIALPGKRRWADRAGKPPRDVYFAWLLARFNGSRETQRLVARHLRKTFEDQRWIHAEDDTDLKLRRHLLGDYYDDLPTGIKRALHVRLSSMRKMGFREYYAVETPEAKFAAKTFWHAAARAFQNGKTKICSRESSKAFELRGETVRDQKILRFAGESADQSFALADPAFSALSKDLLDREGALLNHRSWFDRSEQEIRPLAKTIAAIRDSAERMRQIHFLRAASPSARFEKLAAMFAANEKVDIADLKPAPLDRILMHLRLPAQLGPNEAKAIIAAAGTRLLAEEGFKQAFARLSALPVVMPDVLWHAFSGLPPNEQKDWVESATQEVASPISKLHLFWLVFQSDADWTAAEANRLVDWFFSEEAALAFEAFSKLLLWSVYEIQSQDGVEGAPPPVILAAAWYHASRLQNTAHRYVSDKHTAEFFQRFCNPKPHEIFGSKPELVGDISYPRLLSWSSMLMNGIACAVGTKPMSPQLPTLRDKIVKLCFLEQDNLRVPRLEIMDDPTLHHNSLSSFLGADRAQLLAPLLGQEDAAHLGSSQIQRETEASLNALLADPKQEAQWVVLHALSGSRFAEPLRDRIKTLITTTNFDDLLTLEPKVLQLAVFWLATQAALSADPELKQKAKTGITKLAARCAADKSSGTADRDHARIDALMGMAHCLTRFTATPRAGVREFAEIMIAVQKSWPAAGEQCWSLLSQFAFQLPQDLVREMSPLILHLRCHE